MTTVLRCRLCRFSRMRVDQDQTVTNVDTAMNALHAAGKDLVEADYEIVPEEDSPPPLSKNEMQQIIEALGDCPLADRLKGVA